MKKAIFIAVLGAASAVASYGQGNIFFGNYYSSHQTTGFYYSGGAFDGLGVGPEISVELFYSTDSTATSVAQLTGIASSITPVGMNGASGPAAFNTAGGYTGTGVFNFGNVLVPGTPGATYAFAIYAFGTYQSVNYSGWTGIFTGATQGSGIPLPTVPNLPSGLVNGSFAVSPTVVPEPGTLALAGLGGFGMLMALRRKKA